MSRELVSIPVIDVPQGPLQLASLHPDRVANVLERTKEILPSALLRLGDGYARRYLSRSNNPYLYEIDQIARLIGGPGAYALNFSFEMGCTTGCHAPYGSAAMQLYRTLDWPFRLGADVVVATHQTAAGTYANITWPGYIGVLTALAPGRFAAAINQPPMTYTFAGFGMSLPVDWLVNRWRIRNMTAMPPTHLLRQVFERCATYEAAKIALASTPICIPVIFTLTGTGAEQGCIIERCENDAVIHEGPVCITNHWINPQFRGRPRRGRNSRRRLAAMQQAMPRLQGGFDWLTPPVLDSFTRLAAEMNAATGHLLLQGWHGEKPQTEVLKLRQA